MRTRQRLVLQESHLECDPISFRIGAGGRTQIGANASNEAIKWLSTEGQLYLCLFASRGHDLRSLVRGDAARGIAPASDAELASAIGQIWHGRSDRYSQLRGSMEPDTGTGKRRVEMSYIGG